MHGDQRGRARGLDGDARPSEVQLVRNATGEKIFIVAYRGLIESHSLEEFAVGENIPHIAVGADSGVDADCARVIFRVVTSILKRLPCAFEKDAMLRVHDFGFARVDAKELRIEQINVFQYAPRLHVIWITQERRLDASCQQLLVCEECDALDPVTQISPELVHTSRARKAPDHSDDGDVQAIRALN